MSADHAKEALRQQMLLRALWRDARPGVVQGWMRDGERFTRGLQAYQANAGALAERALGAAYPTVAQLVGEESFAALARAFWLREAPARGDIGLWGARLPAFITDAQSLASEPYLADVARLDWAVHEAERAADTTAPEGLERLATLAPELLRLSLAPGCAVVASPHPIVAIWAAHRVSPDAGDERFAPVREAFAARRAETAWVARHGWRGQVRAIDAAEQRFVENLLAGQSLAHALVQAGDEFNFERWLITALQQGWLVAVVSSIHQDLQ